MPAFSQATFTSAIAARPDVAPAHAVMLALAEPRGPALSSADMIARKEAELRFYGITDESRACVPAHEVLWLSVCGRWDWRIRAAQRREARS